MKLRAELVKTSLLAAAALTVSIWVTVELKALLPVAVIVGVPALVSFDVLHAGPGDGIAGVVAAGGPAAEEVLGAGRDAQDFHARLRHCHL